MRELTATSPPVLISLIQVNVSVGRSIGRSNASSNTDTLLNDNGAVFVPWPTAPAADTTKKSRTTAVEEVEPVVRGTGSGSVVSAGTVGPPQRDLGKQAPLDKPLSPLVSPNCELREIKAVYDRDKAEWQAERQSGKPNVHPLH
ncbi:hypothetical protein M378DRAFT_14235 [Amanita muscaria Koide BX008]|uniref:Uncharacterized protein n=1 Tax=Amanita muscaria (strain Koide BX008) TaxID=946122 RepID=A0A0C2WFZ9_AMAMK|nr:hypothetical protein M378DRAFT_14235 [Amanita muscaria Koide BX008]